MDIDPAPASASQQQQSQGQGQGQQLQPAEPQAQPQPQSPQSAPAPGLALREEAPQPTAVQPNPAADAQAHAQTQAGHEHEGEANHAEERPADQQQSQQQPQGSPPLPQKHTAVTPGPRAARLQEVFADRLARTLDRLGWANFAACYPTVAARAPATLRFVQRQMVERLGAQCRKEFEAVLANRNVVPKLNELESLISDAARRKAEAAARDGEDATPPVPPHLLPASSVLQAHLSPHLATHQAQLTSALSATQAHNARLFAEIGAQRVEAAALLAAVEKVVGDIDGAAALLLASRGDGRGGDGDGGGGGGGGGGGLADEMAEEARVVEIEMGM